MSTTPNSPRGDGLYPVNYYAREDDSEDGLFYASPRLVVHIDDPAIAAVGRLYAELMPPRKPLLDMMSAWRTHLPEAFQRGPVTGLGMNGIEMMNNPQLDAYVVHDLNQHPALPFPDESFDGAVCTVSVQYLLHPVQVFREVHRVLRPGAPFAVTFSDRCFPTKAVALWVNTGDQEHQSIVASYFKQSASWERVTVEDRSPGSASDPLYAVWGYKSRQG